MVFFGGFIHDWNGCSDALRRIPKQSRQRGFDDVNWFTRFRMLPHDGKRDENEARDADSERAVDWRHDVFEREEFERRE